MIVKNNAFDLPTAALLYAEQGVPVFPCRPNKTPWTVHGFKDATTDEKQIRSWWSHHPDALIGVPTGEASGWLVLDIDVKDGAKGAESLSALIKTHGQLPATRVTQTRSGGWHYYFKNVPGVRNSTSKIAPGVDVRAEGGYVIVPPSEGYCFTAGTESFLHADAPAWLVALATPPPAIQPTPAVTSAVVASTDQAQVVRRASRYLAAMPPAVSGARGHDATYAAATAMVHGFCLSPDEALGLLMAEYNPRCVPPDWTEAELRHKVMDAANKSHDKPRGWLLREPPSRDTVATTAPQERAPRVRWHEDRHRDRLNPPPMIIADLLPEGGIGAIVALPGVGKTLEALAIAASVASGIPFAGHEVNKGAVLYVCNDAPASSERRMLAMSPEAQAGIGTLTDLPSLPDGFDELRECAKEAAAAKGSLRLIVLDTWDSCRQHASGGYADQDAITEEIMRGLRSMATELRCAVLIIHHTTWTADGRPKGPVVFAARCDWIARVDKVSDGLTLETTKSRDGETGMVGAWSIVPVLVGEREVPTLVDRGPQGTATAMAAVAASGEERSFLEASQRLAGLGVRPTAKAMQEALGWASTKRLAAVADRLREQGLVSDGGYGLTPEGLGSLAEEQ
jgi:hypothetical protein